MLFKISSMYYIRKFYRCHLYPVALQTHRFSTAAEKPNKLFRYLRSRIESTGPISVADYMKEVLLSPVSGYYMSRDVFGRSGDFTTSPEISQIFGELIGVWLYNEWFKIGKPQPLQLVEFGPGRGTLMDDVLRVLSQLTSTEVNLHIHFIEASPHLCQIQKSKLCSENNNDDDLYDKTLNTKYEIPITWHRNLESVPEGFSLFLAHEFFDALPIHKFQKTADGWREILIDVKNIELQFVLSRNETPATKFLISADENRDHLEVSTESGILLDRILKRIKENGGIALIIDYGHEGTKTDTFRSFKEHKLHNPLKSPGEADLTADVDFSYLRKHANGKAVVYGPVTQSSFLHNMGIEIRLQKLMESAMPDHQKSLQSGYEMLTKQDQMGERFKFFALYPLVLKNFLNKHPPAGF